MKVEIVGSVENAIKTRWSELGMKTSSIKGVQIKVIQMGGESFKEEDVKQACHMEAY